MSPHHTSFQMFSSLRLVWNFIGIGPLIVLEALISSPDVQLFKSPGAPSSEAAAGGARKSFCFLLILRIGGQSRGFSVEARLEDLELEPQPESSASG